MKSKFRSIIRKEVKNHLQELRGNPFSEFTSSVPEKIDIIRQSLKRINPRMKLESKEDGLLINDEMLIYEVEKTPKGDFRAYIEFYPYTSRLKWGKKRRTVAGKDESMLNLTANILRKGIEEGIIEKTEDIEKYLNRPFREPYEEPNVIEYIFLGK